MIIRGRGTGATYADDIPAHADRPSCRELTISFTIPSTRLPGWSCILKSRGRRDFWLLTPTLPSISSHWLFLLIFLCRSLLAISLLSPSSFPCVLVENIPESHCFLSSICKSLSLSLSRVILCWLGVHNILPFQLCESYASSFEVSWYSYFFGQKFSLYNWGRPISPFKIDNILSVNLPKKKTYCQSYFSYQFMWAWGSWHPSVSALRNLRFLFWGFPIKLEKAGFSF